MVSWDDVVGGILTGGAYNVAKAVAEGGDAISNISNDAGTVAAAIAELLNKIGSDLDSFIAEIQKLMVVRRYTPRDESELWDDEVEQINALRQKEQELTDAINNLDNQGITSIFEYISLKLKLLVVQTAIQEILYNEPGVIPTIFHSIQESIQHFNNTTLPRIEETIDSVNDNFTESLDIAKEVKKLFVVTTFKAIEIETLPETTRQQLNDLENKIKTYDDLINKNRDIASQLQLVIKKVQPSIDDSKILLPQGNFKLEDNTVQMKSAKTKKNIQALATSTIAETKINQPGLQRISSIIKLDKVSVYMANYNSVQGFVRYFERERLKTEKEIFKIKWVIQQEPGVIPSTLDEIKQTAQWINQQGTKRIETSMDNINQTILESKNLMININSEIQKTTSLISQNKSKLTAAAWIFGGLTGGILVTSLVILIRIALRI